MSRFVRRCLKPAPVAAVLTLGGAAAQAEPAVKAPAPQKEEGAPRRSSDEGTGKKPVTERFHVIGHPFNTLHADNDMGRLPQDVLHTPQTIDVVPNELIRQQNVKSLDEALRNVPGITSSIGEGAGGMNGDQFLIRGFPAQNDIYEDGLRDFGVYTRDSFNYDSVNVIKGPSSEVFGNGTTGGAINVVTKAPSLLNRASAEFSGGSGQYYRGSFDVNRRLNDHTAVRIEGMGNENNVVGRDYIYAHRWGIAPSVAFGLGTRTTVVLQLMHQSSNAVPDYGVPIVTKPGQSIARPITRYGIRRSNWYGKSTDQDATSDTMETLRLKHRVNDHITFNDDLRFGEYTRQFAASKASCDAACVNHYFGGTPDQAMVIRSTGGGGPMKNIGGAPQPYQQWSWSVQNVASVTANFHTAWLRHQLVGGFDIENVHDRRAQYTFTTPIPYANLVNPNPDVGRLIMVPGNDAPGNLVNLNGLGRKANSTGYAFDVGLFLYDQIWLADWISVKGGLRWDRWQTGYRATGGSTSSPDKDFTNTTNVINPTVSLLITPTKNQTFYFTWATSTTPTGMYVTNGSIPIRPPGQAITDPEKASLYELGTKISAFHERMGFTASLFRLEKNNAFTADPITGAQISTGDTQRNQGLELSASGVILPGWNITATYALYDPKTTGSQTAANIGRQIQYVPHNQATVWSVYELFHNTPWNLSVGGGVTWRQGVWLDPANTARAPANLEFDGTVSHRFGHHWVMSLNGYNLGNRLNYSSLFVNRITPAPGRTFLGRLSLTY